MKNMCFLVVAGELFASPATYRQILSNNSYIIAADKGAEYVLAMDLLPNEVHGDFDSIDPEILNSLKDKGVPLFRYPVQKDQTDLEIVADVASKGNWQQITIIGGWGKRIDHSLASLAVLAKINSSGKQGFLLTPYEQVELITSEAIINDCQGETLSLLAWNCPLAIVDIEGCDYAGKNITLKPEGTLGISNVINEPKAIIKVKTGTILMIRNFSHD